MNITTHPAYDKAIQNYQYWCDLYEGGDRIEAREKFLPRHTLETDNQYQFRLRRSVYKNYVKPIVGVWNSHVWRCAPVRTGLESFAIDTDKGGIDTFFQYVTLRSLVTGVHFVLVDAPQFSGNSKKEARDLNYKPRFLSLDPLQVINWGFVPGSTYELDWVTLLESSEAEATPFTARKYIDRYRVISRDKWQLFEKNDKSFVLVDEGINEIGKVPVVPFYYSTDTDMIGTSLIKDIASLVIKLFQKENEMDICEFYSAVPFLFFRGFTEEEIAVFIMEPGNAVRTDNVDAAVMFIESGGAALSQLRETTKDLHTAIQEIALRQLKDRNVMPLSYIRARLDKMQLETQLEAWSHMCSESEKRCWMLVGDFLRKDYSHVTVTYNTDFSLEEVDAAVIRELRELALQGIIQNDDVVQALKDWEVIHKDKTSVAIDKK